MNAFPPDDQDGPEDAGDADVAVRDPIEELADLRPWIVADTDDELTALACKLEQLTGWSRDELLDQIGCEERDPEELHKDPAKVGRCTRFLEFLVDTAELVDTPGERRAVVRACARVSKATGQQDAEGLQVLLDSGTPSASELFGIGELSAAERAARIAAGIEQAPDARGSSPYDALERAHFSLPRLELYVQGKRAILGEGVYARMTKHLDDCQGCAEAVESWRSLGRSH